MSKALISRSFLILIVISLLIPAARLLAEPGRIIKIGVTLPLSGSLAHIGVDIRRGMDMALDEVKDSSVKYEIIYEDNQHNQTLAVSSAQKLLNLDRADILISLWDMADVVAPLAERKKVPHLSIRWNPHVAEKNQYTITFESTYLSYVASQVDMLKAWGAKTIGLVTEESQGWTLSANALKSAAQKQGIKIVSDQNYIAGTPDFSTLVSKLLTSKPDVVVINGHQPNLDLVLRRIREQKPQQAITGYFEAVEPPSLVEGLPFVAQFEVRPWFNEQFKKRYGENFKVRAAHGYDLIKMIAYAYKQSGAQSNGLQIITELSKLNNYEGASGLLSSNNSRNIENQCVWMIVKNGKFEGLGTDMAGLKISSAG